MRPLIDGRLYGGNTYLPTSMRRINGDRSSKTIKRLALALPAISVSETDARNGKMILITN